MKSLCYRKTKPNATSVKQNAHSVKLSRLRVVPHFSSGIVERVKREHAWKSPHARKGDTRRGERKILSPHRVSPFLARGDFHARSRFARSTIPEEKWGSARSLKIVNNFTWCLCTVCFSISYVSMVTRAIKRTQRVFTGSQTRKAIMESIVTFIDVCNRNENKVSPKKSAAPWT